MSDLIDRCNLRLMRTEECAGHTIEYALGWKACIEWMKTLPSAQPDVPDRNVGDMISRQAEPLELQLEQVGTHIIKTCPTCDTPWQVPPTSEYLKIAKYPCCPCGQRIRWEWRDE